MNRGSRLRAWTQEQKIPEGNHEKRDHEECWIPCSASSFVPQVVVNLTSIKENYEYIKAHLKHGTTLSAVVKYDSYGLGAKEISSFLAHEAECKDFWCTYMSDAIILRTSGAVPPEANVYYFQGFGPDHVEFVKKYSLIPTINSTFEFAWAKGKGIPMVIHVDTGFTRLAVRENEMYSIMERLLSENVKYIMSHLSCGDDPKSHYNIEQKFRFDNLLAEIRKIRPDIKATLAATGGVFLGKNYHYDMVRCGAFLYGIGVSGHGETPRSVLDVSANVLQTYSVPKGVSVGYGASFVTERETKVAVIAIGYADGIRRSLSNNIGKVLFYSHDNGGNKIILNKAPIIGRISMDLLACDITNIQEGVVKQGEIAHILDCYYTINDMAADTQTIPYEILTSMNFRIPKIYTATTPSDGRLAHALYRSL
ncbi:MAG: alanine racemase [Holosporales bacterium]|jgi:alanine racemase|nr:alanine racemase [Holosporales bacterium]